MAAHPSCCGVAPRRSVSELFERGFRRSRTGLRPSPGAVFTDPDGCSAQFSMQLADGRIVDVAFRASTCATLLAYCELVAELAAGRPVKAAARLTTTDIVRAVAGVPAGKHSRAILAIAAFRSALAAAAAAAVPLHTGTQEL